MKYYYFPVLATTLKILMYLLLKRETIIVVLEEAIITPDKLKTIEFGKLRSHPGGRALAGVNEGLKLPAYLIIRKVFVSMN